MEESYGEGVASHLFAVYLCRHGRQVPAQAGNGPGSSTAMGEPSADPSGVTKSGP